MNFTGRVLVAGWLAVACVSVGVPTAGAVFPGTNGKIVVVTEYYPGPCGDCDPGGHRAWVIGREGRTASFPAQDVSFSPSGSRIAYRGPQGHAIWIARPNGSKLRLLTGAGWLWSPEWSPVDDGIAYGSLSGLVVTRASGGEKRLLTAGYTNDFAWAPNGEQLAFVNDNSLSVVGSDGQNLQTVATSARPGYASYAFRGLAWSASGWLSYRRGDGLIITRPGETDARVVLRGLGQAFEYSWAADGQRLAFVRDGGLWVTAVPNGTPRLIVPPGMAGDNPQWSPDGQLIAYARGRRVFTVPARGGKRREFARVNDRRSGWEYVADIDWQARPAS